MGQNFSLLLIVLLFADPFDVICSQIAHLNILSPICTEDFIFRSRGQSFRRLACWDGVVYNKGTRIEKWGWNCHTHWCEKINAKLLSTLLFFFLHYSFLKLAWLNFVKCITVVSRNAPFKLTLPLLGKKNRNQNFGFWINLKAMNKC